MADADPIVERLRAETFPHAQALVVVGLGFGDEGKGTVTDYLARRNRVDQVVRFNGGGQAGHNVVLSDGRWHCFAQFGAATFRTGTRSFLGPATLVELEALVNEGRALLEKGVPDAFARLTLSPSATLVTPFHKAVCQMREVARGASPRGTCGMGIGVASRMAPRATVADVLQTAALRDILSAQRELARAEGDSLLKACPDARLRAIFDYFERRGDVDALLQAYQAALENVRVGEFDASRGTIFEGAQGALLHRDHGFRPYVTPSCPTADAALDLWRPGPSPRTAQKIGVLRPYAHRHGAGPLVTECASPAWIDPRNRKNRWQGAWRTGWLDLVSLHLGLRLNGGVDALAVTNLDGLSGLPHIRVCRSYRYEGDVGWLRGFDYERRGEREAVVGGIVPAPAAVLERCAPFEYDVLPGWYERIGEVRSFEALPTAARELVHYVEDATGVPVRIVSVDPTPDGKIDRW